MGDWKYSSTTLDLGTSSNYVGLCVMFQIFTAMSMKIIIFCDMNLYRFWIGAVVSEKSAALIYSEEGGAGFLRNAGIYVSTRLHTCIHVGHCVLPEICLTYTTT
jgi:hypothetical protein